MNLGTPIARGNTAEIYLYDNKIVKVYKDYLPDTESTHEANKQKCAYSYGLFVPEVLDITKIAGKQAIIMEYIKGRTLGELLLEDIDQAEYYLKISVDIQQKIHSIIPDSIEPMYEKLHRQIETAHNLEKKYKSYLLKKLDSMTIGNRLCHGDFHLFNLIMTDNKVAIIDWVDSTVGDIRADIYRTYLLYSHFSSDLAEMYLRLYCEESGMLRSEIFQWAPIIAAARMSDFITHENSNQLMEIINRYCPF